MMEVVVTAHILDPIGMVDRWIGPQALQTFPSVQFAVVSGGDQEYDSQQNLRLFVLSGPVRTVNPTEAFVIVTAVPRSAVFQRAKPAMMS